MSVLARAGAWGSLGRRLPIGPEMWYHRVGAAAGGEDCHAADTVCYLGRQRGPFCYLFQIRRLST